jgi:hypothetical protein
MTQSLFNAIVGNAAVGTYTEVLRVMAWGALKKPPLASGVTGDEWAFADCGTLIRWSEYHNDRSTHGWRAEYISGIRAKAVALRPKK